MRFLKILAFIFIIISCSKNAYCQVIDSSIYGWIIYEYRDDEINSKECYMVLYPIKSQSDHNFRQKPYLMITRYQDSRIEEVSIYGGYEYKINSEIMLLIDNWQFKLSTKDDMAWTKSPAEDVMLIQKLLNSPDLKVRSNSSMATFAIDEYNLKGITRAYARIKKICE
jgi:hypothetical protein